jgi:polyhydroxybutyrate depolymerase
VIRLSILVLVASCASHAPDLEPDAREVTPDAQIAPDARGQPDAAPVLAPDAHPDAHPDTGSGGLPLVLLLHGYNSTGAKQSTEWFASSIASSAVVLAPDAAHGTSWNASHACCDLAADDDEGFLVDLVRARLALGDIDPTRVYVVGHSNGGFMAWRLLCDHAELFAAGVVASGGANSATDPACTPSRPMRVLHIHGTADSTVAWGHGGTLAGMPDPYLPPIGPQGSTDQEAFAADCTQPLSLTGKVSGVLTSTGTPADVDAFSRPCAGAADLWRINGGIHAFKVDATWLPTLLAWLDAAGST